MQRRRAEEKEKQEKIRLGLIAPPPPKGIFSHLFFVEFYKCLHACVNPLRTPHWQARIQSTVEKMSIKHSKLCLGSVIRFFDLMTV